MSHLHLTPKNENNETAAQSDSRFCSEVEHLVAMAGGDAEHLDISAMMDAHYGGVTSEEYARQVCQEQKDKAFDEDTMGEKTAEEVAGPEGDAPRDDEPQDPESEVLVEDDKEDESDAD